MASSNLGVAAGSVLTAEQVNKLLDASGEVDLGDGLNVGGDINQRGFELINSKTIVEQQVTPFYHFDGDTGKIQVPNDASFANIFTNGGTFICKFNAFSTGKNGIGRFLHKLHALVFSSGEWRLAITFSGTNGQWASTGTSIPLNKDSIVVLRYDGSNASNNPTLFVDGEEVILTEISTPTGTISTDVGSDLVVGNEPGESTTFDGNIYQAIILNRLLTSSEAKSFSSNPQKALAWADKGGSNIAENISNCENRTPTNGYNTFDAVSPTGFHAVKSGTSLSAQGGTADEIVFVAGRSYGVSFNLSNAGAVLPAVRVAKGHNFGALLGTVDSTVVDGLNYHSFTPTESQTGVVTFSNFLPDLAEFTVSNINVHQLGAILVLNGNGFTDETAYDSSGNGNDGAVTGVELVNKNVITMAKVIACGGITTDEKNALTAANGMIVYDSTLNKFQGYENGSWTSLI